MRLRLDPAPSARARAAAGLRRRRQLKLRAATGTVFVLSALAPAGVPASASAVTVTVTIPSMQFDPFRATAVAGDVVRWHNTSRQRHVALARDGTFSSGYIEPGGEYRSGPLERPGSYDYFCTLHPDMSGELDVFAAVLSAQSATVAPGAAVELAGRVPAGTASVVIERVRDSAAEPVSTVTPAADGTFSASVTPTETSSYRALVPSGSSPAVEIRVAAGTLPAPAPTPTPTPTPAPTPSPAPAGSPAPEQTQPVAARPPVVTPVAPPPRLALKVSRSRRQVRMRVAVTPIQPRDRVAVLEVYSRERFRWRAARRSRLDASGVARFRLRARPQRRARIVVIDRSSRTRLAVTRVFRL